MTYITLLRSMTMSCETDSILQDFFAIFRIQFECGKCQGLLHEIMLVP